MLRLQEQVCFKKKIKWGTLGYQVRNLFLFQEHSVILKSQNSKEDSFLSLDSELFCKSLVFGGWVGEEEREAQSQLCWQFSLHAHWPAQGTI